MKIGRNREHSNWGKKLSHKKGTWVTILLVLRFQERNYIILRLISEGFAFLPGHLTPPHFISHTLSRPDSRFTLKRLHSQGHWEWRWGQELSDWRMELWFMLGCKFRFWPGHFYLSNMKSKENTKRQTTWMQYNGVQ